ncbi:MAG: UDP-N-acetylmuramate dehydrogenase [bacterium]
MPIQDVIEKNIKLAPFTTFNIGGEAAYFVNAFTADDIVAGVIWAKQNNLDFFILGGGSNVLISDDGFPGLVIKNATQATHVDALTVISESGTQLSRIVHLVSGHDLSGLEWAAGMPGTLGGAICGNAGAFGVSMQDIVESVTVFDLEKQTQVLYSNPECAFSYRHSIFRSNKNLIILSAKLNLKKGNKIDIEKKMLDNVNYRVMNQPKYPSAGSVFKNLKVEAIREADMDLFELAQENGAVRGEHVSAGWLVDKMHLKGERIGGAMASETHGNFIINKTSTATAEDVIMLISMIKQKARTLYGVKLTKEIQYVGF